MRGGRIPGLCAVEFGGEIIDQRGRWLRFVVWKLCITRGESSMREKSRTQLDHGKDCVGRASSHSKTRKCAAKHVVQRSPNGKKERTALRSLKLKISPRNCSICSTFFLAPSKRLTSTSSCPLCAISWNRPAVLNGAPGPRKDLGRTTQGVRLRPNASHAGTAAMHRIRANWSMTMQSCTQSNGASSPSQKKTSAHSTRSQFH
jgi:hypothetical protein